MKQRHVLSVLRSALSSSPGNETGFDRLAKSFNCAVPVLTQTLIEELHVLSRLAEPHTILAFLNAVYLNTVVQELASQMERECETAQRDNTAPSSKIKKYSARSRTTVGRWSFQKFNLYTLPTITFFQVYGLVVLRVYLDEPFFSFFPVLLPFITFLWRHSSANLHFYFCATLPAVVCSDEPEPRPL